MQQETKAAPNNFSETRQKLTHSYNDVPARHLMWKTNYPKTKFQGTLTVSMLAMLELRW